MEAIIRTNNKNLFNALIPFLKTLGIAIETKKVEAERSAIFKSAKTAVENYKKRKVKKGTAKDLYKDLEND